MSESNDELTRRLIGALRASGEMEILTSEEVKVLRLLIGWVEFASKFGRLGKFVLWLLTALGGLYLMFSQVIDNAGWFK